MRRTVPPYPSVVKIQGGWYHFIDPAFIVLSQAA